MSVKVTWLGHAAFSLQVDEHKILIDPFLTDNPTAAVTAEDVEADYILAQDPKKWAERVRAETDAACVILSLNESYAL